MIATQRSGSSLKSHQYPLRLAQDLKIVDIEHFGPIVGDNRNLSLFVEYRLLMIAFLMMTRALTMQQLMTALRQ